MTLNGAIKQLHELRSAEDMPIYYKPAIAEVINVLLIDTQEVKHGRWIDTGSGQECSVCGEIQYGYDSYRNYFPNCGAKMDMSYSDSTDYKGDISYTNHTVMGEVEECT